MSRARKDAKAAIERFSDEQWKAILAPLGKKKIPIGYRQFLVVIADVLRFFRNQPSHSFAKERDLIERISKHSTALYQAIEEHDACPSGLSYLAFDGDENSQGWREQWREFVAALLAVQKAARKLEEVYVRRKPRPANVDIYRNITWSRLGQFFHQVTGREPRFKVATENTKGKQPGEVYGDFVEFVQAFMATVPGEEVPSGNTIREYIRKSWNGERLGEFAHD
jgi:hypothetical protein